MKEERVVAWKAVLSCADPEPNTLPRQRPPVPHGRSISAPELEDNPFRARTSSRHGANISPRAPCHASTTRPRAESRATEMHRNGSRVAVLLLLLAACAGCAPDDAREGTEPPSTSADPEPGAPPTDAEPPSAIPDDVAPDPRPSQVPPPPPLPPPTDPGSTDQTVFDFEQKCAEGVESWRAGQVDFPERLTLAVDQSASYNAAVDVRSAPLPPGEVILAVPGAAEAEEVLVKCTVAARLRPVGDSLDVDDQSGDSGAWIVQDFTPSGVVEWFWTVTAEKPKDSELILELRPAVAFGDESGDLLYAGESVTAIITDVTVEASFLSRAAYWVEVNMPLVVVIAGAAGAGVIALAAWWTRLRKEFDVGRRKTVRPGNVGDGSEAPVI